MLILYMQALLSNCLRNPFISRWREPSAQEELCVPKLRVYGYIFILFKIYSQLVNKHSKDQ